MDRLGKEDYAGRQGLRKGRWGRCWEHLADHGLERRNTRSTEGIDTTDISLEWVGLGWVGLGCGKFFSCVDPALELFVYYLVPGTFLL